MYLFIGVYSGNSEFIHKYMIDWLDITVPCIHKPIEQGRYIVVEHDGEVLRESSVRRRVEGSYCTSIAVSSVTPSLPRAALSLPSSMVAKLFHVLDLPSGYVSHLSFSGNPTKYLQGHNCFGIDCLRTLARGMVADVMPRLGFDVVTVARVLQRIDALDFEVSRVDITRMFALGSDEDVQDYLYMLPLTVKARGNRCGNSHDTFYVGQSSTLWTLKFYNKWRELQSRSKHHSLPDELKLSGIDEFVKGQLRVELTLRKKQLDRYQLTNAAKLQEKISELFIEHAGKIDMTNQSINEKKLLELSNTYQGTYQLWKSGYNMMTHLSRATYYRHRAELLKYGIDIAKTPIDSEVRRAVVEPLIKHLIPREVTEIPAELQSYLLKVA